MADQQDVPRVQARIDPRDRRFAQAFFGIFLGSCFLVAAASVVLDPLATFGTGAVTPVVWLDRDQKAQAYARLWPKPELLILGSSRVMKARPARVAQIAGVGSAFNFAVNSARAEDHAAILRMVADIGGGRVTHLLIGVDPECFHDNSPPDPRLEKSRHFRPYVDGLLPATKLNLGEQLLSLQALESVEKSLRHVVFGQGAPRSGVFDDLGFLSYPEWEEQQRRGVFVLAPNVQKSLHEYRIRYANFRSLDPKRLAAFREMLERARVLGAVVSAFIPPLHPDMVAAMQDTTLAVRTAETRALLASLERERLLEFHDFESIAAFGGRPDEFFDGAHLTEASTTKLVTKIYQRSHAVQ